MVTIIANVVGIEPENLNETINKPHVKDQTNSSCTLTVKKGHLCKKSQKDKGIKSFLMNRRILFRSYCYQKEF